MADKDKISIFQTTTTKVNGKTQKTQTERAAPGKAWVKSGNFWVRPKAPAGDFTWDDNAGWQDRATATAENEYALPLALINSDPELKALFDEAWIDQKAGKEWTQEKFNVRLQGTNWFKTKSEPQRLYYTLKNDPAQAAEFARQVNAKKSSIASLARANGISLSDQDLDRLANTSLEFGYADDELTSVMADYIDYKEQDPKALVGSLTGNAGLAEDGIRDWAKRNMITVSDSWIIGQVRNAAKSGWRIDSAQDAINNMARQQFSHWADQLDGNTTLDDLAGGFKNLISDEFDEDVDSITFDNKFLKKAMMATDDKGKPINTETLRRDLYQTDEWSDVTKNKNKLISTGRDILTRMGF
jgi:Tfp pilus assembly protein PilV